ncbi:MAG: hypothetical protein GY703_21655 [Gammaproteobacteria bacterium]|nr:hypothetical protein [Gammaproteobacteria bacterium]
MRNTIYDNSGYGAVLRATRAVPVLYNAIYGNGNDGLYLQVGSGSQVNFNRLDGNVADYLLSNANGASIDARHNWWGATLTALLETGEHPRNIPEIYDVYDDAGRGSVNYAAWLGAEPAIPEGLLSNITTPLPGARLKGGVVRIEGVAVADAEIDYVEISIDGGTSWFEAQGTQSWSWEWQTPVDGTYNFLSRVTDINGLREQTGAGISVTIESSEPTTSGVLTENETWSGEILLDGDVTVPEGVTLTIAPGTQISLPALRDGSMEGTDPSRSEWLIAGELIAQGTEDAPIVISSAIGNGSTAAGDWIGLMVTGSAILEYVTIEYGRYGIQFVADSENDYLIIEHSTIRYTDGHAVSIQAMSGAQTFAQVLDSELHDNEGHAVYVRAVDNSTVLEVDLAGNQIADNGHTAIYLLSDGNSGDPSLDVFATDNRIAANLNETGIYALVRNGAQGDLEFNGNEILDTLTAMSVIYDTAAGTSSLSMSQNNVHGNNAGILIDLSKTSIDPLVFGNLIFNNAGDGLQIFQDATGYDVSPKIIANQLHHNTGAGLHLQLYGPATLGANSLFQNGNYDLVNGTASAVDARGNWWGDSTTMSMNAGGNPKNIDALWDTFDDATVGTVDYSDWLTTLDRPASPGVDNIEPATSQTQVTLTGTKSTGHSILINGFEVVGPDAQSTWSTEVGLSEGRNTLIVQTADTSGLVGDPVWVEIIRDSTAPSLYMSRPSGGVAQRQIVDTVEMTLFEQGTAIDAQATLASVLVAHAVDGPVPGQWQLEHNLMTFTPDAPLSEGSYAVSLSPMDVLGNNDTLVFEFSVDLTDPTGFTMGAPNTPTNETTQTLQGTKGAGSGVWLNNIQRVSVDETTTWSFDISLTEGINRYWIQSRDAAGNTADDAYFAIELDRVAPRVVHTEPTNGSYINVAPEVLSFRLSEQETLLDFSSILESVHIQNSHVEIIDGTWSTRGNDELVFTPALPFDEEAYSVFFDAVDLAGNTRAFEFWFELDTSEPIDPIVEEVTSPTNYGTQELRGAKEPDTALIINDTEVIALDGDTSWTYDVELEPGVNSLSIRSRDAAGNNSPPVVVEIVYDDAPPLPVSTLTTHALPNGVSIRLDWSGYDEQLQGDLDRYRVYVAEQLFTNTRTMPAEATLGAGVFTHTVSGLKRNTRHFAAVVATDTGGNTNFSVTAIDITTVDTTPPEPPSNPSVESFADSMTVFWHGSANSAGDLAGYKVYLDDDSVGIALNATEESFHIEGLEPATAYSIKITALDGDGNESSPRQITATTELPNPLITGTQGFHGGVELTWDAVEPAAQVHQYAIYQRNTNFTSIRNVDPVRIVGNTVTTARIDGLENGRTYYFAVATINTSGGRLDTVQAVPAIPVQDLAGPQISDPRFSGSPLGSGDTLALSGDLRVTATDAAGVHRVSFEVDGVLLGSVTSGSDHYTQHWDIAAFDDGERLLKITALDTLGNTSETELPVIIVLAAPAAPSLTAPQDGLETLDASIGIAGTARKNTEILLYNNGYQLDETLNANVSGHFSGQVDLLEGENRLQVAARNRGGVSPLSNAITVIRDVTIPEAPTGLGASGRAGGEIRLSWIPSSDASVTGYLIYRSTEAFDDIEGVQKITASPINSTQYIDLTPADGRYYYRIAAVNAVGTSSTVSNISSAESDNTPPHAVNIRFETDGPYDAATGRFAPGLIDVSVTLSEPLRAAPFVTIAPAAGVPIQNNRGQTTIFSGSIREY